MIGADGSYTYTADQSAADDLDAGDSVTDVFTYTVTDENGQQQPQLLLSQSMVSTIHLLWLKMMSVSLSKMVL